MLRSERNGIALTLQSFWSVVVYLG